MPAKRKTSPNRTTITKEFQWKVSSVRGKAKAIAIGCSDLHITDKVPVARGETDWFDVQKRYFTQLRNLQIRVSTSSNRVPVLIAGDIFDKPKPSPEVINFAIDELPLSSFAVPGQHDLLHHSYDEILKSGFFTLVKADRLTLIESSGDWLNACWFCIGSPWGKGIRDSFHEPSTDRKNILICHRYIWTEGGSDYDQAPNDKHIKAYKRCLRDYKVAIFGDNHKSFLAEIGNCTVFNGGCFIRRRSTERDYTPQVCVIYDDGSVVPVKLDTREDIWATNDEIMRKVETEDCVSDKFINELKKLGNTSLDFKTAVRRSLEHQPFKAALTEIIEDALSEKDE